MKILIIGGTRFIGPRVISHLSEMGHEITVFHRGQTPGQYPEGVASLYGDRNNLHEFRKNFKELGPDVVIDMICMVEEQAKDLVKTFRDVAGHVVMVSSSDVYRAYGVLTGFEPGDLEPVPLTEKSRLRTKFYPYRGDNPRDDEDPYKFMDDYDKILCEKQVMDTAGFSGTVLRLPMVYGPRDRQHRLKVYIDAMSSVDKVLPMNDKFAAWKTCRGYVDDVAWAIALAATNDKASGKIYNVADETTYSEAEWAKKIAKSLGWPGKVLVSDKIENPQQSFNSAQHLTVDSSLIRKDLGYREKTVIDDAISRTISWEKILNLR